MDSNNSHQQITKKLEEIKELNDVQQKKLEEIKELNVVQQNNFTEENDKNNKLISTLQRDVSDQKRFASRHFSWALGRKKEIDKLNAEIIQLKDQLETKQKLELENQKLKEKLDSKNQMEEDFLKLVSDLHMELQQKERSLQDLDESYTTLIIQERQSNEELQKARKILIKGIEETSSRFDNVVVKRMGELDTRPFLKAMSSKRKYCQRELPLRALELCSLWESYLEDPHWHPFKVVTISGHTQEIIDDKDRRLNELKKEVSVEAYKAVVVALKELNEYNPSGRTVVSELWNKRLGMKASLEEVVEFLLNQRKTKRKKNAPNPVVNNVNSKG